MALGLAGKNPVKFEFDDGLSQTTVVVHPDDDSGTIAAKLRRVLELEAGSVVGSLNYGGQVFDTNPPFTSSSVPPTVANLMATDAQIPFTPADRAATDARLKTAQPLGWETANTDDLPEA